MIPDRPTANLPSSFRLSPSSVPQKLKMDQRLQRCRPWRHQHQQDKLESKVPEEERLPLFHKKQSKYFTLPDQPTINSILPSVKLLKFTGDLSQSHKRQPRAVTIPERAIATSVTGHTTFEKFSDLPYDIVYEFFKYLDPVTSTCLGLTCNSLYKIHRRMQGIVGLEEYICTNIDWTIEYTIERRSRKRYTGQLILGQLLQTWMGPELFLHRTWNQHYHYQPVLSDRDKGIVRTAIFWRVEHPPHLLVQDGNPYLAYWSSKQENMTHVTIPVVRHLKLVPVPLGWLKPVKLPK